MALRFMDGFDSYVTADVTKKWASLTSSMTISAGNGRRSTASLRCGAASSWVIYTQADQGTWILGSAIRFTALPSGSTALFYLQDGAGTTQCDLRLTASGTLQATRNSTVLGTSTLALSANTYAYVEVRFVIHNTLGEVEVRVNGTAWLTLSSQDTQNAATALAASVRVGCVHTANPGTLDFDDLYICDGTGSAPHNTFLGDCRVDTLFPAADGSNSAWTCSTGTAHAALVDETAPNDDTDSLSSSTPSARDTHAMGNLSAMPTPTIFGVQHVMCAKKEDAGTCAIKNVLKSGATTEAGATSHALSTSYAYYRELWTTDPNTDAAWTTAAIDAVEAGVEKV